MDAEFHEPRRPGGESVNRWGDPPPRDRFRMSRLAIAALAASALAFVLGPLHMIMGASVAPGWNGPLSACLRLTGLVVFPAGMLLSYLALLHCRLDRPLRGRPIAWGALAISFVALGIWEAALTGLSSWPSQWLFYGILLLSAVHLAAFAAESTAGRYLLLIMILAGVLFSLVSLWALQSREAARRVQAGDNLRKIGMELHQQWEMRRERP